MRRLWLALGLLVGCDPRIVHEPKTQLTLRIHASPDVQQLGETLQVSVDGGSSFETLRFADVARWPLDLLVIPGAGNDLGREVQVLVRARNARDVVLQEDRALTSFVQYDQRVLELVLQACGEEPLGSLCEPDQACRGSDCLRCREQRCEDVGSEPGSSLTPLDPDATIPSDPAPACAAEGCPPLCALASTRCAGDVPEACTSVGTYEPMAACEQFCAEDACDVAPSCSGALRCGENQECCLGHHVPGGDFRRSYDGVDLTDDSFTATLSPFVLDRFEVTVGRMRAYLKRYDNVAAQARPHARDGKSRAADDEGWSASWNELLPASQAAAIEELTACPDSTYGASDVGDEQKPVNCVSWYLAQAFCIWDGGRLPTEAEWNFAAAGGDEQRVFPWSVPPDAVAIDPRHAVYDTDGTAEVGSLSPKGDGRWGHADLAGNLSEWVYDWFTPAYVPGPCQDCANVTPDRSRVIRGGNFTHTSESLRAGVRARLQPGISSEEVGFRCARPVGP